MCRCLVLGISMMLISIQHFSNLVMEIQSININLDQIEFCAALRTFLILFRRGWLRGCFSRKSA